MYEIKYGIGLNDDGRPYINLPQDYENRPEDRFFAIEMARYILQDTYNRRSPELDGTTGELMRTAINLLGQVGDQLAEIMFDLMKGMGEFSMLTDLPYNVIVNSIEERDNLAVDDFFVYDDKLFKREIGLKVLIQTYDADTFFLEEYLPNEEVYELVEGITNEHWKKI